MCFAIFSFFSAIVMGALPPSGNENKDDRVPGQPQWIHGMSKK